MRRSVASHHQQFQQAFAGWRMPRAGQPRSDPAHVAKALEDWLSEFPGNAGLIQQFAAGAAATAEMAVDWPAAQRIAEVGLSASQTGALATTNRLHTATVLALQATRAAMELDSVGDARKHLEQAAETLSHIDANDALKEYLQWHMHLLGAELSEAALERAAATEHFEDALRISRAHESDTPRWAHLQSNWIEMLYGRLPPSQAEPAQALFARVCSDMRVRTVLGWARSSRLPEAAQAAVTLCVTHGLPLREPVLATHGVLSALPAGDIDASAQALLALAERADESLRATWQMALFAQHAEAWLNQGDIERASGLLAQARAINPARPEGISVCLLLSVRVRVAVAKGDDDARSLLDYLIRVRTLVTEHLTGSRWGLPFRVACEPAVLAGVQAESRRLHDGDDVAARRSLSLLLDALRAPQEPAPPDDAAADRIGRLAAAAIDAKQASAWLVLVLQAVNDGLLLIAIGADKAKPMLVTLPDRALLQALQALDRRSIEAQQVQVDDGEIELLGRAAFDALAASVRERVQRADTLIVVPDFGLGQDSVPIELLHDGNEFLGASKIVTRCLSLTHALRVVEAPLVTHRAGKHGLCVAVSQPPGFAPLKFADAEFETVREALTRQMWDVAELRESTAEPTALLELLPLAHLMHIACHGEASAGAEALVLGGGARLTALEFATRHPVRCVTYLNACSLARGRYLGGGVSRGVAYAFARAGAPAVLANLSAVEDESAAQLAEAFYLAAQDLPVGEALRSARQLMQSMVSASLWSPTVLIGNPWARIDGRADDRTDATAALFNASPLPTAQRLAAAQKRLAKNPGDLRLAAAVRFSETTAAGHPESMEEMAALAREIGHDIGEAHCLIAWLDVLRGSGDQERLGAALDRTITALEPLRNAWQAAFDAHAQLQRELRALDPTYHPRELKTSTLQEDGISINDRSDPAVDAVLRIFDALHEHEAFWRGTPRIHQPDLDLSSAAHNAVVQGYLWKLYDGGAEADHAEHMAQRLGWRGLVPQACVPNLGRILAGLLHFLWGQQGVKHLEHWMEGAHAQVILLALEHVSNTWSAPATSAGAPYAREIAVALDRMKPSTTESKFARARAALRDPGSAPGADLSIVSAAIGHAIEHCRKTDPMASAELAAWILGELMQRIDACERAGDSQQDAIHAYRSVYDEAVKHNEDWFMPYLMEGFKGTREQGGQDVFYRWSQAVL